MYLQQRSSDPLSNLDEIPRARSYFLVNLACIPREEVPNLAGLRSVWLEARLQFNASTQEHCQFSDVVHRDSFLVSQ